MNFFNLNCPVKQVWGETMKFNVSIHKKDAIIKKEVIEDITIMDFLRDNSINLHTPCGGNKICGKCRIKVSGMTNKISVRERNLLGDDLISQGFRLACFNNIESDIDIYLDDEYIASILTEGRPVKTVISPLITMESAIYGLAFDIGTTTLVTYLYNLKLGNQIDVLSIMNPQQKFGADIISRIAYGMKSKENLEKIHCCIIKAINKMIKTICTNNHITENDIYETVFVGNTTMMHYVLGLDPKSIAKSPFTPLSTDIHFLKPIDIGVDTNKEGCAVIYPSVSAYIGADTVAAVLSTGINEKDEISLLIDIGTNGEIVLGNKKKMYSCAAAAGPAFEGANIRNGIGGIVGAIDSVYMNENELKFKTIGAKEPIGICGSGVLDVITLMLREGIIDETGRIAGSGEDLNGIKKQLRERLIIADGHNAFRVVKTKKDIDIVITQKDVRELQNAKAAIAAAIKILLKTADISAGEISKVYLSGGFGNFLNIESALKIGLLPEEFRSKIISVGNAAGTGAILGLLSKDNFKKAVETAKNIEYIELSTYHEFMDIYVDSMLFDI